MADIFSPGPLIVWCFDAKSAIIELMEISRYQYHVCLSLESGSGLYHCCCNELHKHDDSIGPKEDSMRYYCYWCGQISTGE